MHLAPGLRIIETGLYLEDEAALIFSDVHIGYEEALNKQGVLIPRFQFKDTLQRAEKMLAAISPRTIVIAGDLKHEFGRISEQEWRETLKFLDFLAKHCDEIILVQGNHDTILGPIAQKRKVKIVDHYRINDFYIHHGHEIPHDDDFGNAKVLIIGHEHPAVTIRDTVRAETFKCFLKGTYKKKQLIVLPSFQTITTGTDILSEKLLSPFLHQKLDNFDVFVVADKAYDFGKVRNLR